MMIELRLIRHALALAGHGNFARAAQELHLTQPSLSRSIATLESQLGVTLFDRTRQGVVPTAFGRVLLERGERVLRGEADLRREIGLLGSLHIGKLTVAAGPYMNDFSVARALGRMLAAHPQLQVECRALHPAEVVAQVLDGKADIGVANTAGLDRDERLVVEPLPVQRIYLACRPAHPLTREPAPTVQRALQFPLVTARVRGEQAALAARHGGDTRPEDAYGPDYTPQVLVNSIAMARLVAQTCDVLVPGTAAMLADDVAAGRLVRLDCSAPAMRTNNGLLHLRDRSLAPAARLFMQLLRQVEAEDQAQDEVARPPPRPPVADGAARTAGARRRSGTARP